MPAAKKKRGRPPGSLNKLSKESRENLAYVLDEIVTDLSKRLHKMSDRDKIAFVIGLAPYVWPKVKPEGLDEHKGPWGVCSMNIPVNNFNNTNRNAPNPQNTKKEEILEEEEDCNEEKICDEEEGCDEEGNYAEDDCNDNDNCPEDDCPDKPPPKRR